MLVNAGLEFLDFLHRHIRADAVAQCQHVEFSLLFGALAHHKGQDTNAAGGKVSHAGAIGHNLRIVQMDLKQEGVTEPLQVITQFAGQTVLQLRYIFRAKGADNALLLAVDQLDLGFDAVDTAALHFFGAETAIFVVTEEGAIVGQLVAAIAGNVCFPFTEIGHIQIEHILIGMKLCCRRGRNPSGTECYG